MKSFIHFLQLWQNHFPENIKKAEYGFNTISMVILAMAIRETDYPKSLYFNAFETAADFE